MRTDNHRRADSTSLTAEAPVRTCLLKPAKLSPFHPVICNLLHETLQYNKAEGKTGDLK